MHLRQARSGTRGRPPCRWGFGSGRRGSITSHKPSGTSVAAIKVPSRPVLWLRARLGAQTTWYTNFTSEAGPAYAHSTFKPHTGSQFDKSRSTSCAYASGTSTATLWPPSAPETPKLPTGPGASHVPSTCSVPPAVPDPLTVRSATSDRSAPHMTVPYTVTSLAKEQLVRVVIWFPSASKLV